MQKPSPGPALDAVLAQLACPVCHAPLTALAAETVLCTGCDRRYPVRDGLLILLAQVAQQ